MAMVASAAPETSGIAQEKPGKFTVVRKQSVGFWDRFSVSPVPYYCCFSLFLAQYLLLNYWGSFWGIVLLAFGIVPALDILFPHDLSDPNESNPTWSDSVGKFLYKLPLFAWPFVSTWQVYWGCKLVSEKGELLTWIDILGLVISTASVTGGIGITVAHELLHKPVALEKVLAYWQLALTSYMHFVDEHQYGHHKWVATIHDPATSRFGQSFYAFYPQTVIGSWKSAWEMNSAKMRSQKKQIWSVENQLIWFLIIPFAIAIALAIHFGSVKAFVFFYAQGIVGFSLLELVNYIEHYGLLRSKLENGNYEPVNITHSWNAPHRVTNYFLFKLQRHSDHHAHALRPYELLRNFMESPQLPSGYPSIIILSLFPTLFFSIMDPVIDMYRKDKSNGLKFTKIVQTRANTMVLSITAILAVGILAFTGNSLAVEYA